MHNTNWRGSLGQLGREGTTSGRENPRAPFSASKFSDDVACTMEVSSREERWRFLHAKYSQEQNPSFCLFAFSTEGSSRTRPCSACSCNRHRRLCRRLPRSTTRSTMMTTTFTLIRTSILRALTTSLTGTQIASVFGASLTGLLHPLATGACPRATRFPPLSHVI